MRTPEINHNNPLVDFYPEETVTRVHQLVECFISRDESLPDTFGGLNASYAWKDNLSNTSYTVIDSIYADGRRLIKAGVLSGRDEEEEIKYYFLGQSGFFASFDHRPTGIVPIEHGGLHPEIALRIVMLNADMNLREGQLKPRPGDWDSFMDILARGLADRCL